MRDILRPKLPHVNIRIIFFLYYLFFNNNHRFETGGDMVVGDIMLPKLLHVSTGIIFLLPFQKSKAALVVVACDMIQPKLSHVLI